jgi:hypothetical protein
MAHHVRAASQNLAVQHEGVDGLACIVAVRRRGGDLPCLLVNLQFMA